jgi:ABC-2 type transport system permease protein
VSALAEGPPGTAAKRGPLAALAARHRGLIALSARESHRVLKLWTQTVVAPILSSFLFILVFGLSLGSRIKQIDGVDYEVYIVPGLIAMAMIQATYANNSASVFQARFDRYLNDVLAAPMRPWEVNLALSLGGVVRALLIGAGLLACAMAVVDVPVRHPLELAVAVTLALVLFSSFGVIVGVYANSWDHTAFVTNIVILPLTFLGGVFYSVDRLPTPWHEISHANPIFYLLNAVRYGFLGTSDVSFVLALGVTGALAAATVAWSSWLFRTGHRLKP